VIVCAIIVAVIAIMAWGVATLQKMRRRYPKVEDLPEGWEE
jgi:hypothetical protein